MRAALIFGLLLALSCADDDERAIQTIKHPVGRVQDLSEYTHGFERFDDLERGVTCYIIHNEHSVSCVFTGVGLESTPKRP